ncbi:hypothetical protein JHK87_039715 [Glycine soja]|nr:hypothetical protein JHK87_039715 [Glycine soja]
MLVILYTVSVKNYTDNGLNLNSYECYAVNQHVLSLESILLINHQVAGPRGRIYTPELVEQVGNVMIAADSSSPQEPQHASQAPPVSNTNKNHNQEVLSVTLDEWSSDKIDAMIEVGGNSSANSIYEAYFPKGYTKPGPDVSHEQRAKFIRPLSWVDNGLTGIALGYCSW